MDRTPEEITAELERVEAASWKAYRALWAAQRKVDDLNSTKAWLQSLLSVTESKVAG